MPTGVGNEADFILRTVESAPEKVNALAMVTLSKIVLLLRAYLWDNTARSPGLCQRHTARPFVHGSAMLCIRRAASYTHSQFQLRSSCLKKFPAETDAETYRRKSGQN